LQPTDKNEPANVARVAQTLADIRRVDMEEMIAITYSNFGNLLKVKP
jgi:Tat protein secretion system quality control protein TatD with DNase activity